MTPAPRHGSAGAPPIGFLLLTAALCGGIVMVLEVLGSRVVGPFFGVSLFVWTALISVTLVALALGYAAGGALADRWPSPDRLYGLIIAAGALTLLVPVTRGAVLKAWVPLGLRTGAFVSSLVLFGPPLFLLGCVSPYVVRLAAREIPRVGRTVGLLSAVSTAGSFLGTLLTGYVLIAHVGVERTFQLAGATLVVLGIVYFAAIRRRWQAVLFLALALPALRTSGPVSKLQPNGTRATVVFDKDTFYGRLKVVDYTFEEKHTRELLIDGLTQGGIDMKDGRSVYEYAYSLELLPWAMRPGGKSALVVGLGAGVVPVWLERQGVKVDVIDIDPDVVEVARRFFGFRVSGEVFFEDARAHLSRSRKTYDYVLLDVFNGDTTPGHVLSREALELGRSRLAPDGLLVSNLIGTVTKKPFMTASVVKTLESLFATVEVFPLFSPEDPEGYGNVILVAHRGPPIPVDRDILARFPVHPMAKDVVDRFFGRPYRFPPETHAIVLCDDYNPIDFYDRWVKERIRAAILEATDWDVLL
jgi:spermidine synthase